MDRRARVVAFAQNCCLLMAALCCQFQPAPENYGAEIAATDVDGRWPMFMTKVIVLSTLFMMIHCYYNRVVYDNKINHVRTPRDKVDDSQPCETC